MNSRSLVIKPVRKHVQNAYNIQQNIKYEVSKVKYSL